MQPEIGLWEGKKGIFPTSSSIHQSIQFGPPIPIYGLLSAFTFVSSLQADCCYFIWNFSNLKESLN